MVFSSHVASGTVGNRAMVFALELLGLPVWAINTIQLAWHPGHGPSTRIVDDEAAFAGLVDDLAQKVDAQHPVAVLSGYLGSPSQAGPIAAFVQQARASDALYAYLCDPVMGDHGGLYVPLDTAEAIRDQLVPLADIITPNRFELGWLSGGAQAVDTQEAVSQAKQLGVKTVLATSAPSMITNSIGNLLVSGTDTFIAEHRLIEPVPKGTGDLFAALYFAHLIRGRRADEALGAASGSVYALANRAAKGAAHDFHLEQDQDLLRRPPPVPVRRLVSVRR
ncbi:MAG: pyridoxal kinase [Pseudomonadota bacterium]